MFGKFFTHNEDKISKNITLYFFLIVVINILFKSFYLDYPSYWYDEIISIKGASEDFGHIKHVSDWDNNPPFYYYCLSVWIKLFNDSEFYSRLLSVLFSSFSAGVLFIFTNKYFNKTTAIVSSFLFLASNMLYYYSHEVRAYSLVVLIALISSYLFFEIKEKPSLKYIILLGLINFLLIYTHYISGLVLVFQFLIVLFVFPKEQKKAYLYSCLIVFALTFIRFTKKQFLHLINFNKSETTFWLKKSDLNLLMDVLSEVFYFKYLVVPLILIILLAFLNNVIRKDRVKNIIYIYSFLIGIGSIVVLFLLGKLTPIFLDRYLIFAVPFVIITIAYSFSFLKSQLVSIVFSALFFIFCSFQIDFKAAKQMDYRNMVYFIKKIKEDNDLIIVKTTDVMPLFGYYYEKDFLKNKKKGFPPVENIIFCNAWAEINSDLNKFKRVIVVDSFQEYNPNEKEFKVKIKEVKEKIAEINFYKGAVISIYK